MVNSFPDLLIYGILAPTLIRISLGSALLYLGVEHVRSRKEIAHVLLPLMGKSAKGAGVFLAAIEIVAGMLLVVGAWTQIAALVAALLALKSLFIKRSLHSLCPLSRASYLLLLIMTLSLLLSGAGAFAFDLPL